MRLPQYAPWRAGIAATTSAASASSIARSNRSAMTGWLTPMTPAATSGPLAASTSVADAGVESADEHGQSARVE